MNASNGSSGEKNSIHSNGIFIENKGQLADSEGNPMEEILFTSSIGSMDVYFTKKKLIYVLKKIENNKDLDNVSKSDLSQVQDLGVVQTYRYEMAFDNSNLEVNIYAEEETRNTFNYYLAHCPDGIIGSKGYKKLIYENIYPGIDMVFYPSQGSAGIKYDYIVHPGSDPSVIGLIPSDTSLLKLVSYSELQLSTPLGIVSETIPAIYQEDSKSFRKDIKGQYVIKNGILGFELEPYDKTKNLVIDPFFTYYGGNGYEYEYGISVTADSKNNIVITGTTQSTNLPVSNGMTPYAGGFFDAFIAKFDNTGQIIWSTYLGGTKNDLSNSIAIDASNNLFIGGGTNGSGFPADAGSIFTGGQSDAFIASFDENGVKRFAKYFGGTDSEAFYEIAIDMENNVVVCGATSSGTGMPMVGCPVSTYQGGDLAGANGDGIACKYDNDGNLIWSTYLGGENQEVFYSIDADKDNNVVITGYTDSENFVPSLTGTLSGYRSVVVIKLDEDCGYQWGKYLGGSSGSGNGINNTGKGVSVHKATGEIVVVGETNSTNFPTTTGVLYESRRESTFITKYDSTGNIQWSTYYGGTNSGLANDVVFDANGDIWVTGRTSSTNFPTTINSFQPNTAGGTDAFISKIGTNGDTATCASYYGGSGRDEGLSVALSPSGSVIIAGITRSTDLNFVDSNSHQDTLGISGTGPSQDFFLASICSECALPFVEIQEADTLEICGGGSITLHANGTGVLSWSTGSVGDSVTIGSISGDSMVYVTSNTVGSGCQAIDSILLRVGGALNTPEVTGPNIICAGDEITLIASTDISPVEFEWFDDANGSNSIFIGSSLSTGPLNRDTTFYVLVRQDFCESDNEFHAIDVMPLAVIDISGMTEICKDDSTTLTALGGEVYEWTDGSGTVISNTNQLKVGPSETTKYYVYVTENNCNNFDSVTVTVNELPEANAGSNQSICKDEFVYIGAPAVIGNTYSWVSSPSGFTSSEPNPTVSPSETTIYTLVETINNTGCENSNSVTITVNPTPEITVSADTNVICIGENVQLTAFGGASYSWSPNSDLDNSNIPNPKASPTKTTSYTVVGTSMNGCTGSSQIVIEVIQLPISAFTYKRTGGLAIEINSLAENANSFYWDLGDRSSRITNVSDTSHIYAQTGPFTVCLVASNVCGTDSTCATIQVDGTVDDIEDTATSVNTEYFNNNFKVYPNPVDKELIISSTLSRNIETDVSLFLYDISGKLVGTKTTSSKFELIKWDVSEFESGAYLLKILASIDYESSVNIIISH